MFRLRITDSSRFNNILRRHSTQTVLSQIIEKQFKTCFGNARPFVDSNAQIGGWILAHGVRIGVIYQASEYLAQSG